jgi:DNA-directed RNA polymerase specialized sigma24 family protein
MAARPDRDRRDRGSQNPRGGGRDRRGSGKAGGGKGRDPKRDRPTGENEKVQQLEGPLRRVLDRLPATQRDVLELRMGLKDGHPHDLADTARALGLSLSEAREIEQRAFAHIREAVPLQQLQRFLPR